MNDKPGKRPNFIWIALGLFAVFSTACFGITLFIPHIDPMAQTSTSVVLGATLTQNAIATSEPTSALYATFESYHESGTAIALTREPELAAPPVPYPPELTATRVQALDATAAFAAFASPLPSTQVIIQMTATAVVRGATQIAQTMTANPNWVPTDSPTQTPGPCPVDAPVDVLNWDRQDLSQAISAALILKGYTTSRVSVITATLVTGSVGCGGITSTPLSSHFSIWVYLSNGDDQSLVGATEAILAVLANYPPGPEFGLREPRLDIVFASPLGSRVINTGYENAYRAYTVEGLRGVALIEALGGISS